jgi:Xaa-Pro aminopeptidase
MSDRIERLRALLPTAQLDAMLVTSGTNRRYLTGFTGDDIAIDESSGVVIVSGDDAILFTASTNLPWAQTEAGEAVDVQQWATPWTASVNQLAQKHRWTRVGFEDRTTSASDYLALAAFSDGTFNLVPVGTLVDSLRARKDDQELADLRRALEITDEAFVAAEARIRIGQTEREIADIVGSELRRLGSEGEAFPTIVASGPNAAKPHHAPGDRQVAEGEPIIIDMGAVFHGYNGDLTRTMWLGHPSEQLVTIYEAVAGAHRLAIPLYKAGVHGRDIDLQVREYFSERGLNGYFIHGLGHGLGLRVHESPSAGPHSSDILEPGNVVTVEPGLYISGWGGVRIENVVAVTDGESEDLTFAPIRISTYEKEQAQ